jgi:hypothetical protein
MFWIQIVWLSVNFVLSVTLFGFIYHYISKKPIVTVTLADHIYRDTIVYIGFLVLIASAGLVHCLSNGDRDDQATLDYDLSMFYSTAVMFFMVCLTMYKFQQNLVNFTNILRVAFAPIYFLQKISNLNCKKRKALKNTFI